MRLETPRLILRPWTDDDLAPFAALNDDPAVMEHFHGRLDRAGSDALAARIRSAMAEEGWGLWAVEIRGGPAFAGFTGLARPRFDASFTPCVEIGWRLARGTWGHGYATEAARAALAFGFDRLHLPEIVAFTAVGNTPSRRVMERIGMSRDEDGDFDHPRVPADSPLRRHVLYRVASPGTQLASNKV